MPVLDGRVPDAGDVFWIDYGPGVGHEQGGRRPSLVVSPQSYNTHSSVFLACPLSRVAKPWPFRVPISPVAGIAGSFVLVDQVRSVDPVARYFKFVGRVSSESIVAVRAALASLLAIGQPPA